MRNKIKQFLETRTDSVSGKSGVSAYRFWKDTNLSRPTAYRLVADSSYIPTGDVLDKICSAYLVQPGELLVWLPDGNTGQDVGFEKTQAQAAQREKKSQKQDLSIKQKTTRAYVAVAPELAKSA
jgi:hypothetical protein